MSLLASVRRGALHCNLAESLWELFVLCKKNSPRCRWDPFGGVSAKAMLSVDIAWLLVNATGQAGREAWVGA